MKNRHDAFQLLHERGCFVIPNPWDIGTAKMMATAGAKALATTSAGLAFSLGRPDMGTVTRDEALTHASAIVSATGLPVSGDLENGFADDPDGVAETIRLAAEAGLSGCSIEDTCMDEGHPAYSLDLAVERIRAAASVSKALGRAFVLCARADGVMNSQYDTEEAIRRIRAFERAGANMVYVPMPPGVEELKRIVAAVSIPVNALAAGQFRNLSVQDYAALGVRRISLGSMLARVTHASIRDSLSEMFGQGTFSSLNRAASGDEIDAMLAKGSA